MYKKTRHLMPEYTERKITTFKMHLKLIISSITDVIRKHKHMLFPRKSTQTIIVYGSGAYYF